MREDENNYSQIRIVLSEPDLFSELVTRIKSSEIIVRSFISNSKPTRSVNETNYKNLDNDSDQSSLRFLARGLLAASEFWVCS